MAGNRNNQHGFGFRKIDNAEGETVKDYPARSHEVRATELRKSGNAFHRLLNRRDEVVAESRSRSIVMLRPSPLG